MNLSDVLKYPIRKVMPIINDYRLEESLRNRYYWQGRIVSKYLEINPVPQLSNHAKKEIDDYWGQFGIKHTDYSWFRWFYGITNIEDPRFIPPAIHAYVICPFYNNENFFLAWKDKNLFERFLPDVHFPTVYLRKIHGRFFDATGNYLSDVEAVSRALMDINASDGVIVKDAWDSGEGRGVKKYFIKCKNDVDQILTDWKKSNNFIVQEFIQQNECFSQFNDSSVNIIRVNSWRHGDQVEILSATLRIGVAGSVTDVCYIDGVERANLCAVKMDGHFGDIIINQFGQIKKTSESIPNPDMVIPKWNEIIQIVKSNHIKIDHFDIIGWDFTVDATGAITCIEFNVERPGSVFYQYVNGPFYGNYTDEVLSYLKDKKNQDIYVPRWINSSNHKKRNKNIDDITKIIRVGYNR